MKNSFSRIGKELLMALPRHKASLTLTHNQHKDYHQSAEQYINENKGDWKDESSKQTAIQTDTVWELQWYPDTPIGFFRVCAPTLEELLELANQSEDPPGNPLECDQR